MKVAVLGASGNAGAEITRELARRGHAVTAIARNTDAVPTGDNITPTTGDASDPAALAPLIKSVDVVVSALHHTILADTLLKAVKAAGVPRLLVTGGAGSLEVAPGVQLIDTPDFPAEWKPFAQTGVAFLTRLRDETEIDWSFFSPAAVIEPGPRLGRFRLGGDQLVVDADGNSRISFADYAIAMADEVEQHAHSRRRFTAAY